MLNSYDALYGMEIIAKHGVTHDGDQLRAEAVLKDFMVHLKINNQPGFIIDGTKILEDFYAEHANEINRLNDEAEQNQRDQESEPR